jgi:MFS family permease
MEHKRKRIQQVSSSSINSTIFGQNEQVQWLCITKGIRTFALGSISIVLVFFLIARGFSELAVGAIFSATLIEDAVVTTLVGTFATRIGMHKVLTGFSLLMILSALVLAFSHLSWAIVVAAVFGIISPAGYEGGPFGAIEQTVIASIVPTDHLAKVYSRYHLAGFAGAALGALVTGAAVGFLNASHYPFVYETMFCGYALTGVLLLLIYQQLRFDSSFTSFKARHLLPSERTISKPSEKTISKNGFSIASIPKQVLKLTALQSLDAFGGGFVTQAIVAYWFYARYHVGPEFLGPLFFWGNVVAAFSFVIAPAFARRFGLLNTMVFTHLPCSLGLCLIPLMPTAWLAGMVILLRCIFSSMDIPARQAFTMLLVSEEKRPMAVAVIDSSRAIAQGIAPVLSGSVMYNPVIGWPFFLAGVCKSTYDVCLYICFKKVPLQYYADLPKADPVPAEASRQRQLESVK